MCAAHDLAAFHAAGRLHNHKFPFLDFQLLGVKVIGAAAFLKFNRDNFHFNILSIGIGVSFQGVSALPGSHFHAAHGQGRRRLPFAFMARQRGFRSARRIRAAVSGLNAVKTGAAQSGAGGLSRLPQQRQRCPYLFHSPPAAPAHGRCPAAGPGGTAPCRGTSHLGRRVGQRFQAQANVPLVQKSQILCILFG